MIEDPFSTESGERVFAHRLKRIVLQGPTQANWREAIDVAGGKGHDPAVSELSADLAREEDIHRPGERGLLAQRRTSSRS